MKKDIQKIIDRKLKETGSKLLKPTKTHPFRLEIMSSSSNRLYILSWKKGDGWQCSCPGWIFRRKCKHIRTITPTLEANIPQSILEGQNIKMIEMNQSPPDKNKVSKKKLNKKKEIGKKVGRLKIPEKKIITILWKSEGMSAKEISKQLEIPLDLTEEFLKTLQGYRVAVNYKGIKWRVLCISLRPKVIVAMPGFAGSLKDALNFFDKKRNSQRLFSSYKKYSGEVRGGEKLWKEAANILVKNNDKTKNYLNALKLEKIPTLNDLKKNYRNLMKIHHPDKGGTIKKSQKINDAFEAIKKLINK